MDAAAIKKKIDMVVVWVIFSHCFLIMMDKAYGWGVLPSIDGYSLARLSILIKKVGYCNCSLAASALTFAYAHDNLKVFHVSLCYACY